MYCPFCRHRDSRVLESRTACDTVRRRRECEGCQKRFTTYERIESVQLLVVKSSGQRQPYDRQKLKAGIAAACTKTDVNAVALDELLEDLELEMAAGARREIPSRLLGELVLNHLKQLNEVAYVRFASVYRQFQSIDDFIAELERLKNTPPALLQQ